MPVIYLDVLIVLNIFIDFLLLCATARILRLPQRRGRLVLAAILGGFSSCLIFLPDSLSLILFILKLGFAFLIIRIAFRWRTAVLYIKQVVVFLVVSALFGGISFAVWFFAAPSGFYVLNGTVYYNVSPVLLTLLTVLCYFIISLYDRLTHKKISNNAEFNLLVDLKGGTVKLRALYDTGHHVTDVFTGSPVTIVSYQAIEPFLSPEASSALSHLLSSDFKNSKSCLGALTDETKWRMIPFKTVNGTGLLPAFRPSHMSLYTGKEMCADITGTYIGVSKVLARGEYEAIIGTDIVNLLEGSRSDCKDIKHFGVS